MRVGNQARVTGVRPFPRTREAAGPSAWGLRPSGPMLESAPARANPKRSAGELQARGPGQAGPAGRVAGLHEQAEEGPPLLPGQAGGRRVERDQVAVERGIPAPEVEQDQGPV